jgi:4-phytase/acid phosphatase
MRQLTNAALAALLCAAPAAAQTLHVERTVLLMRHGVRPPTKTPALDPSLAPSAWPVWEVPDGNLTPHGAAAVTLLAAYDRRLFGPLKCADVTIYADVDQRTVATGAAYAQGIAPGCALTVGHATTPKDPIFSPAATVDSDAVKAAMEASAGGDVDDLVTAHQALFDEMQKVLDPTGTGLTDEDNKVSAKTPGTLPKLKGEVADAATAAEDFLLEYLDGKPLSDVAWGRANGAKVAELLELHPLAYIVTARTLAVARVTAEPLAERIVQGLTSGTKLTVLVGHDDNQAKLGGLLGLHWSPAGYPADDVIPGGGIIFSLLADNAGHEYVTAKYQVQTMRQIRFLIGGAPEFQALAIPGCGNSTAPTACTLDAFTKMVNAL